MKAHFSRLAMAVIALIHILPFYLLINLSFKPLTDTSSKWIPPSELYVDNFINAWNNARIDRALMSNSIVTVCTLILVVMIGAFASYPLARHRTRWNQFMYGFFVSCLIVPALTILVPLYKFVVDIGGMNEYWAIILIQVTFSLPITIFLMTGFMGSVPKELDEAGWIDGCSRYAIFFRIILPLLRPIVATIIIIIGVQVWNDYQFSVFFLQKPGVQTIPVALSMFISQFHSNVHWVAAGCFIGMLPLTLLYLTLQQYFIKGMADGAIKG